MTGVVPVRRSLGLSAIAAVLTVAACGTAPAQRPGATGGGPAAGTPGSGAAATGSASAPGASSGAAPSAPTAAAPPTRAARRYAFPVIANSVSYHATHAGYPATDIFAACGSPVRAVADGVVLEVSRADRYDFDHPDGALKGGLFVSLRGDDGVRYYGSHLSSVAAGVERGVRVRVGQRLGAVGRTGDTTVCHLHFGISPPCRAVGDWWVRRGEVWPAPYLDAWRVGVSRSPVSKVATWRKTHGCPTQPPP
jgi:murein DD-endopeptidase MepM/ murein hydrolase activator NlpD